MKVLHLSIYDRKGGACIAAYRQHQALRCHGVDSSMWVRQKFTADPHVHEFRPPPELSRRLSRISRRLMLRGERSRAGCKGEMFDDRSEHGGMELRMMPEHDLINLQFSQEFVDLPALYEQIPAYVPVVVTLHEMSMFTGGCSYAYGCERFVSGCGSCPLLLHGSRNDLSARSWARKRSAYAKRPEDKLHFVADSHWLAAEAVKSGVVRDRPVSVIHYGLDTSVFRPGSRDAARNLLGLPEKVSILAFAAASVTDERKGVHLLAEAIRSLPNKPFLLTWGGSFPNALKDFPHLHLGPVESEHLVSIAYNACDFFVIPSMEEAFGQTCLEAMACGRPVVGFEVGGIPDMIRHEKTGLLVPRGDVSGLSSAIQSLMSTPHHGETLGRIAREMVLARFTLAANAEAYRKLYERMLDPRRT